MAEYTQSKLSIRQNILWNSAGSFIGLFCQWLITVFVARLSAGYDAAGVYSLAVSVYGIFMPVAQYRMYTYQVSDVRGENSAGEYLCFRAITCIAAIVLTLAYAFFTCSTSSLLAIALYAVYKTITLVIDVFHATDQQNERMDFIGQSLALQGFGSLIAFITVFATTHVLELSICSMAVVETLVLVFFDVPRTRRLTVVRPRISKSKTRHLLITCLPIVLAGVAASAAPSLPRQYLSYVQGDAALGAYASVAAPVAVIQMGASYIYNPLLGYFSNYFDKRDKRAFLSLFVKSVLGIVAVAIVCALAIQLFGAALLSAVYGERILPYLYLLQPLVLCAVLTGSMWFINDLLISLRDFKGTFMGSAASLLASVACIVFCVHTFGMNGVTVASILSCIAGMAVMGYRLARIIGREL